MGKERLRGIEVIPVRKLLKLKTVMRCSCRWAQTRLHTSGGRQNPQLGIDTWTVHHRTETVHEEKPPGHGFCFRHTVASSLSRLRGK